MNLRDAIAAAATAACRPAARRKLPSDVWSALPEDPAFTLLALWADTADAHALLWDDATCSALPVSTEVRNGQYPALSRAWPAAALFERMIHDLWGHKPAGEDDPRPWLDHGHWPHTRPLAARPGPQVASPEPPSFLPMDDGSRMQVPLGPVRGAIAQPAHLRLTLGGERVLRAEARLGYAHKGTLLMMRGKSPRVAARYAARMAADATVAHALAFANAAEAVAETPPPPRAIALRAIMAALERAAAHLDTLDSLGESACAPGLRMLCATQRETLRRTAATAFGHRLMMDCVVPGGVAADLPPGGAEAIRAALVQLTTALPDLSRLEQAIAPRLSGLGVLSPRHARACAVGGMAGRASGRRFDARRLGVQLEGRGSPIHVMQAGDVAARIHLMIAELAATPGIVAALLDTLPSGGISVVLDQASGEGIGCAESARGDVWHWLRLDHGQIAACFARDPGWMLWPAAEQALAGCTLEDVDVIRRSFALTESGVDL